MYESFADFLKAWLDDLDAAFPEVSAEITAIRGMPTDEVAGFLKKAMETHGDAISGQDEGLFGGAKGPVELLPGLDFCRIWALGPSDKTKEALWKYFAVGLVYSLLGDSLFSSKKLMESFRGMSGETMEGLDSDGEGAPEGIGGVMEDLMKKLMDSSIPEELMNSKIGAIAKEITEKITPEAMGMPAGASTLDMLKSILADKEKFVERMMGTVQEVIQDKIRKGELTEQELRDEVMKLKGTLLKLMPKLAGMMAGLDGGGHNARAAMDPRRQKVIDRLRKRRDQRSANAGAGAGAK